MAGDERSLFGDWRPWEHGWIAVREAADLLHVTKQRVHQLIADGRIRARRFGGNALIVERASVEAYATRAKTTAAHPGATGRTLAKVKVSPRCTLVLSGPRRHEPSAGPASN